MHQLDVKRSVLERVAELPAINLLALALGISCLVQLVVFGVASLNRSSSSPVLSSPVLSSPVLNSAPPALDSSKTTVAATASGASSEAPSMMARADLSADSLAGSVNSDTALNPSGIPPSDGSSAESTPEMGISIHQYKIRSGDTLSKVWSSFGAPYAGSLKASDAIKALQAEGSALRVGEDIEIHVSADSDIIFLGKKLRAGKTMELRGTSADGYTATVIEPNAREVERKVTGSIYSSFANAALALDMPHEVIDEFVDLFGAQVEFRRQIQPGDTYTVIFSELVGDDGEILAVNGIKAASLTNNGKMHTAVAHLGSDGKPRFFDENGEQLGRYFLRYPVQFSRISSVFQPNRFHPVLGKHRPHNGVDFAAPTGTPVRTVGDGIVEFAGMRGGAGLMVSIKHCDRYRTEYMHLSRIAPGVRNGSRVSRGELIGAVGTTGLSTGPHLHFGLFDRGRYVDPLKAELPRMQIQGEGIPKDYLLTMVETLKDSQRVVMAGDILIGSTGSPTA